MDFMTKLSGDSVPSYETKPLADIAQQASDLITSLKTENARLSERVKELEAEKRILKDEMEAVDQMLAARNERIESLEAQLDKLHGHKFSERDFTAIASRAETAETRVQELEEEVRRWKEESRGWATMYKTAEARLAQAEGLLREALNYIAEISVDYSGLSNRIDAFLHPEQAEKAETIKHIDEVSAEVEQWPEDQQHLLGGFADGFEKEKL